MISEYSFVVNHSAKITAGGSKVTATVLYGVAAIVFVFVAVGIHLTF
jgi:hypothetical protein